MGEAGSLDNIGVCYLKTQQYDKAIAFCAQGLDISAAIGDQKGQGNSLLHLGNIYEQSEQYDKALDHYQQALEIRSHVSDKKGEAEITLFLAELYAKEKFHGYDNDNAIRLMNNALLLGNEVEANDLLSKYIMAFIRSAKRINNMKKHSHI